MFNLFKLVRGGNLLLIAATQYLVRFCIIAPILRIKGLDLQMSELWFAMLVLATVLLAAGGYAINDYFDTKTDAINRPSRVLVGKGLSRKFAIKLHFLLSTVGSILGIATSAYVGVWQYALIFPLVGGLLWFYSTTYKGQLVIGNLIIAFMAGMVPLLVLMFEYGKITHTLLDALLINGVNLNAITYWVLGFAVFAFVTTLIREVVKDMEDFNGDIQTGRTTIPIAWGANAAKTIVVILTLLEVLAVYWVFFTFLYILPSDRIDWISMIYITATIVVPLLVLAVRVVLASTASHYRFASLLVKLVMVFGVLYTLIFNIVLKQVYLF